MNEPLPAASGSATLPLFFKRLEALDSERHRRLRRRSREDYRFAAASNAIPIGFSELPKAAQEYPIVFAGDGDSLHLAALVGLTASSNLFVGADGQWQGRYVPAYLRCHPFTLARGPGALDSAASYIVAIDSGSPELDESAGLPLFSERGERTAQLNQIVEFLQHYEAQVDLGRRFAQRVGELGLLVSVNAEARLRNGRQFALSGLRVVERGALRALPVEARMELYDKEWLEMIYHHFASLQSFSNLVDRLALREGTGAAA